jgi:hypothetical protein
MSGDQIGAIPRRQIAEDTTIPMTPIKIGAAVMRLALEGARARIGIHEVGGNNRGPEVEAMIARQGGKPGDPWCMVFVQDCYQDGFAHFSAHHSVPRSIHVGHFARACLSAVPLACSTRPTVGAIALHYPAGFDGPGHCGIVNDIYSHRNGGIMGQQWHESMPNGIYALTIEGNTNGAGARDSDAGDSVMIKTRLLSYWTLFVDISRLDK